MRRGSTLDTILKKFSRGLLAPVAAPLVYDWERDEHDQFIASMIDKKSYMIGRFALGAGATVSACGLYAASKLLPHGELLVGVGVAESNKISGLIAIAAAVKMDQELLEKIVNDTQGITKTTWNGKVMPFSKKERRRSAKMMYKVLHQYDDLILDGYDAYLCGDTEVAERLFTMRGFENGLLYIADHELRKSAQKVKPGVPVQEVDRLVTTPLRLYRTVGDQKALTAVATVYRKAGHEHTAMKLEDEKLPYHEPMIATHKPRFVYTPESRNGILRSIIVDMMRSG